MGCSENPTRLALVWKAGRCPILGHIHSQRTFLKCLLGARSGRRAAQDGLPHPQGWAHRYLLNLSDDGLGLGSWVPGTED